MRSKKAIINIISSLLLQIVTIVCGLIVPRLIIGSFGSETNGLITSITQFLGYITLLEAGIGPVIKSVLYKPIASKDKDKIEKILKSSETFFRKISYVFVVYVIVLCAIFPIIMKEQFDVIYTISLVLIISISTFAEYFFGMTYRLYLQAEQKTYIVSVIQMIGYVLNTICIVILIKLNCNIQIVKLVSACIFILRPVLQNIYVKKKYKINLTDVEDNYELKQKWDGLAQHIASVVHNNTDVAILTVLATVKDVSVYSIYNLIISGIKKLIQSFSNGIDAAFGDMIAKGETQHLQKSFKIYELFYYTITTIIFSCTLLLIIPFVKVYTKGITDTNYVLPIFAYIMVMAEFAHTIRLPYSSITLAAGHFKETRMGAWIEAGTNIAISILLVLKYGMVGVAIGTLIAMVIRTIEFIIHASKYILKRSPWVSFGKIGITAIQVLLITYVSKFLPQFQTISYISWIVYATEITCLASAVVAISNLIIYRNDRKAMKNLIMQYIKINK